MRHYTCSKGVTTRVGFDTERKFGVEIEVKNMPAGGKEELAGDIARALPNYSVSWGYYHHNPETNYNTIEQGGDYIKIENDNSCGYEVITPPLKGWSGIITLRKILDIINEYGLRVNSQCGIHIHRDIQDLDFEQLKDIVKFYSIYEPAIDKVVPNSRRANNNSYAKSLRLDDISNNEYTEQGCLDFYARVNDAKNKDELQRVIGGRYHKLNITEKTIEFRQHSGSTDFNKIVAWLLLTDAVINRSFREGSSGSRGYVSRRAKKVDNFKSFLRRHEVKRLADGELKRYIKARKEYLEVPYQDRDGNFDFEFDLNFEERARQERAESRVA